MMPAGSSRLDDATGIACLHGPRWMTEQLEAVLASVHLDGERLPRLEVTISDDGRCAAGVVNGLELWAIALPRRGWLEQLIGQIVAATTMLHQRLVFVHAGAVHFAGGAHILVGDSGAGK